MASLYWIRAQSIFLFTSVNILRLTQNDGFYHITILISDQLFLLNSVSIILIGIPQPFKYDFNTWYEFKLFSMGLICYSLFAFVDMGIHPDWVSKYHGWPSGAHDISVLHVDKIGILCGYAIRSGKHPEGSQRLQGWPQVGPGCWLPEICLPDRIAS